MYNLLKIVRTSDAGEAPVELSVLFRDTFAGVFANALKISDCSRFKLGVLPVPFFS